MEKTNDTVNLSITQYEELLQYKFRVILLKELILSGEYVNSDRVLIIIGEGDKVKRDEA